MERPILFNTDMVKAILNGEKAQTRRLIKPISSKACGFYVTFTNDDKFDGVYEYDENERMFENAQKQPCYIGDILWVRETWADLRGMGFDSDFSYLANNLNKNGVEDSDGKRCRLDYGVKWKPSIHMPRAAARLFLKVTNVRVEHLNVITPNDAKLEGIREYAEKNNLACYWTTAFLRYWDELEYKNDKTRFKTSEGYSKYNPWVWVIEFEKV